jgi:hypothetical protein
MFVVVTMVFGVHDALACITRTDRLTLSATRISRHSSDAKSRGVPGLLGTTHT